MKNILTTTKGTLGKTGSYAGIIIITALLVQVIIDLIYSNQL
ncbi:hypothetical protein [Salinimicrobium marinum]|nr:hypothetical protein [Salinimicrobium marinum]